MWSSAKKHPPSPHFVCHCLTSHFLTLSLFFEHYNFSYISILVSHTRNWSLVSLSLAFHFHLSVILYPIGNHVHSIPAAITSPSPTLSTFTLSSSYFPLLSLSEVNVPGRSPASNKMSSPPHECWVGSIQTQSCL